MRSASPRTDAPFESGLALSERNNASTKYSLGLSSRSASPDEVVALSCAAPPIMEVAAETKKAAVQAHSVLETQPPFRLILCWKRLNSQASGTVIYSGCLPHESDASTMLSIGLQRYFAIKAAKYSRSETRSVTSQKLFQSGRLSFGLCR